MVVKPKKPPRKKSKKSDEKMPVRFQDELTAPGPGRRIIARQNPTRPPQHDVKGLFAGLLQARRRNAKG